MISSLPVDFEMPCVIETVPIGEAKPVILRNDVDRYVRLERERCKTTTVLVVSPHGL